MVKLNPEYPYQPLGTDPKDPFKILGNLTIEQAPNIVLKKEIELLKADPIGLIRGGYLKITDKNGNLVPLLPNEVQMQVIRQIQKKRIARKPVRIVILKGRQFGITTLSEAIMYSFSTQRAYNNVMAIADDQEGAEYLLEMDKRFHEHMYVEQPHLTPKMLRSNESKLEFYNKRSMIRVDTAGKRGKVGRKFTMRHVHGSEVAFWPDFNAAHKSLSQTVPNKHETIIIYETTANGVNDFCKFWRHIKDLAKTGQTDWVPIFLSWKDHHEYSRPFGSDEEKQRFVDSLSKAELDIQQIHGLTLEQMNWRRWKVANDFNGEAEEFAVEFPLDDNEAFRSSGKGVFSELILRPQEAFLSAPHMIGEVELIERRPAFVPYKNGDLKIWELPKKNHRYVIGADSCESAASHDYACGVVLDWTVKRQVAELHGRIAADIFGEKLFALGAWYNWAHIVPESNGPGISTVAKLRDLFYPNLYKRKKMVISDYGKMEELEEFGWHTNVQTKPYLIDGGRDTFRRILVTLCSADLLAEARSFVVKSVNDDGYVRYAAEEGFYDDRLMAFLMALYAARDIPDSVSSGSSQHNEVRPQGRTGY